MMINQEFHNVFGGLSNSENCFVKRFVNVLLQKFIYLFVSGDTVVDWAPYQGGSI